MNANGNGNGGVGVSMIYLYSGWGGGVLTCEKGRGGGDNYKEGIIK